MSELEQKPSPPHTRTATDAPKEGASGASDLGTAEVGHLLPSQWNHLANCLLHTCPHQPREDRGPPPPRLLSSAQAQLGAQHPAPRRPSVNN